MIRDDATQIVSTASKAVLTKSLKEYLARTDLELCDKLELVRLSHLVLDGRLRDRFMETLSDEIMIEKNRKTSEVRRK
jgi:hypothetical protein